MTIRSPISALAIVACAVLASCDNGPSAVASRQRGDIASDYPRSEQASYRPRSDRDAFARADRPAAARASLNEDRAIGWASSRTHSAAENADYHFRRDGADFGARSVEDYVAKASDFTRRPPRGSLTLDRPNGDRLVYDPTANVFAVATKDGLPRTMFKPRDGMDYWREQTERAQKSRSGGRGREADAG